MTTATTPHRVRTVETDEADFAQLPASCGSVAEIHGPYSVAVVRSRCEGPLARYLADRFIDFYNPRRRVIRFYDGRRKEWGSALFPGILFVGHGQEGRDACGKYGERHHNQFRGFIGFAYEGSVGQKLLDELGRVERMLTVDPSLEGITGLRRGVRVRVNHPSPFQDLEGVIEGDGGDGRVYVNLPWMGGHVPIPVARDLLTILD